MSRRPAFDPKLVPSPAPQPATGSGLSLMTVSALTRAIRGAITRQFPSPLHVVGQISNYKRHSSGHVYLTLKDEESELACVMWQSAAASLKFQPSDGMEVIATGHLDVYEKSGRYQLYVRKLEPRGIGALELAFRQLRDKLAKEGLCDEIHKKPLPAFPRRLALVTSPTGAAVRDMLQTLRRRFPVLTIFVYPVRVQGEGAAGEIASALRAINRHQRQIGGIDLIIVARGGGSLEDLWAFNEEVVARAIFASTIPVISGVGHEVDVTIADLVADVRAATPTAAAELAVPLLSDVLDRVANLAASLGRTARHEVELARQRLARVQSHPIFARPLTALVQHRQRVDDLTTRLVSAEKEMLADRRDRIHRCEMVLASRGPQDLLAKRWRRLMETNHRLDRAVSRLSIIGERHLERAWHRLASASPLYRIDRLKERVNQYSARLDAGSPQRVLERGFSITRLKRGKLIVHGPSDVRDGDRLITQTSKGEFESEVVNREQLTLFGGTEEERDSR